MDWPSKKLPEHQLNFEGGGLKKVGQFQRVQCSRAAKLPRFPGDRRRQRHQCLPLSTPALPLIRQAGSTTIKLAGPALAALAACKPAKAAGPRSVLVDQPSFLCKSPRNPSFELSTTRRGQESDKTGGEACRSGISRI